MQYVKEVRRNRETRDWDAYVTIGSVRQYIGSRRSPQEAESLCDQYVYELLQSGVAL